MIEKAEIDHKSEELGVHVSNVQRDYVFGWLLAGLFQSDNQLQNKLILKGGNAFRKAYFENARFSNDLDFSTQVELNDSILKESIKKACCFANKLSGVRFLPDDSRIGQRDFADEDSKLYEARVYFKSFYGEENIIIKVKLDIKEYDKIFLPIQTRKLIHAYSDAQLCQADLRCFKLEELLALKLRALLQRQHSPDLYDFVYSVLFQKTRDIRRLEVITTFLKKTIYEPNPQIAKSLLLDLPFQVIKGLWNKYLVCPKLSLIAYEEAESRFRNVIEDLFALLEPKYTTAGMPRGTGLSYFSSKNRDIIMEAGRLERVLQLTYDGIERHVEPYSLAFKRRKDGIAREYFYVWDLSGGRSGKKGIKSFIAEKLRSIEMTEDTFKPRYPIELAKIGGYFGKPYFSASTSHSTSSKRSRGPSQYAFKCIIECPYCGKRFNRTAINTQLNEHKDRLGNPCYGRIGVIVSTGI